ncbi:MAG: SRPBCC family protein [Gaiellaceae bacterium]
MASYVTTVESSLPPAAAFAYMADFANARVWDPSVIEAQRVGDAPVGPGTEFDLVARFGGRDVPLRPPLRFADVQLHGPYRHWEHTHSFAEVDGGTEIRDRIRYRLRGGPLASVADRLGHRAMLSRLFDYRTRRLTELLADG